MAAPNVSASPAGERGSRSLGQVRRSRVILADGATTTLYVARYAAAQVSVGLAVLRPASPLQSWCAAGGVSDAVVGGFFTRPDGRPLGELRTHGIQRPHVSFDAPWSEYRACLRILGGMPSIALRDEIARAPAGDLLQAGPMLVREGRRVVDDGADPEGFSAGAAQFDSDIADGRYPRAALGVAPGRIDAVVCDGRATGEAGLTLGELADVLVALGARDAINLDGGGSASLVAGGVLRNRPRADRNAEIPGGRPVSTALTFTRRR